MSMGEGSAVQPPFRGWPTPFRAVSGPDRLFSALVAVHPLQTPGTGFHRKGSMDIFEANHPGLAGLACAGRG